MCRKQNTRMRTCFCIKSCAPLPMQTADAICLILFSAAWPCSLSQLDTDLAMRTRSASASCAFFFSCSATRCSACCTLAFCSLTARAAASAAACMRRCMSLAARRAASKASMRARSAAWRMRSIMRAASSARRRISAPMSMFQPHALVSSADSPSLESSSRNEPPQFLDMKFDISDDAALPIALAAF